jgi:hypothetical protein
MRSAIPTLLDFAKDTDLAMQKWVNVVQASLDDDPAKPPRGGHVRPAAKPPIRCGGAAQLMR